MLQVSKNVHSLDSMMKSFKSKWNQSSSWSDCISYWSSVMGMRALTALLFLLLTFFSLNILMSTPTLLPSSKMPMKKFIDLDTNEKSDSLLILSVNPRSGSSLLADVLTPSANPSMYFFEPLARFSYEVDRNGHRLPDLSSEAKIDRLHSLLSCSFEREGTLIMARDSRSFILHKPTRFRSQSMKILSWKQLTALFDKVQSACYKVDVRVAKTIRLSLSSVLSSTLLSRLPRLRVIVLMRDPRAIAASLDKNPGEWPPEFLGPDSICSKADESLQLLTKTSSNRLLMVKYEDLMEKSEQEIDRITRFLNWPNLNEAIMQSLREHGNLKSNRTGDELEKNITMQVKSNIVSYFSPYRASTFKHDRWKTSIRRELRYLIESNQQCKRVIKRLYT